MKAEYCAFNIDENVYSFMHKLPGLYLGDGIDRWVMIEGPGKYPGYYQDGRVRRPFFTKSESGLLVANLYPDTVLNIRIAGQDDTRFRFDQNGEVWLNEAPFDGATLLLIGAYANIGLWND